MNTIAPFRISVCGLAELGGHCETGVSHVLSILDPDWPVPEELGAFGEHARLELRFHDVIEDDDREMIAPSEQNVTDLLAFGRDLLAEPPADAHLLVHCHAGVSRSTASMALIVAQARPDVSGEGIFAEIMRIRPQAWPNLRLIELGDTQLGRHGELVAAAAGLYRKQIKARRHSAEQMRSGGRGREVDAALGCRGLKGWMPTLLALWRVSMSRQERPAHLDGRHACRKRRPWAALGQRSRVLASPTIAAPSRPGRTRSTRRRW